MATSVEKAIIRMVKALMHNRTVKKATAFISPTLTIVSTNHNKPARNEKSVTVVLTMGKPNFENRIKIKELIAAKEPFPVKKLAFKFYPEKSKKKK